MKKLIVLLVFTLTLNNIAAQIVVTRNGEIKFEASVNGFEEIAATSKTASCILNQNTGEMASLCLIKAFKFKSPLMEEHFNENYMESSKFPKATFKGKILNFDTKKLSATKIEYDLEGSLMIHGVTKKIKVKIGVSKIGNKIVQVCSFFIKPQDYNIEIPSLVKSKIAENIKVEFNFTLEKL